MRVIGCWKHGFQSKPLLQSFGFAVSLSKHL